MNEDDQKKFKKNNIVISNSELFAVLIAIGTTIAVLDAPQDFFVSLKTFFINGIPEILACAFLVFCVGGIAKSIASELSKYGNKKIMTALSCVIIVAALSAVKYNFFMTDEEKSEISGETVIDEDSDNYQAGFEAGEKSVKDNPEDNGLINKEDAADYVVGDYPSEEG